MENECGSLESEVWNGIDHPIEEMDLKLLEERGMVIVLPRFGPFELKIALYSETVPNRGSTRW